MAASLEPIAPPAATAATAAGPPIYLPPWSEEPTETSMGKGDLRTRRGKIYNGSYGKTRPGKIRKKDEAAAKAAARTRK